MSAHSMPIESFGGWAGLCQSCPVMTCDFCTVKLCLQGQGLKLLHSDAKKIKGSGKGSLFPSPLSQVQNSLQPLVFPVPRGEMAGPGQSRGGQSLSEGYHGEEGKVGRRETLYKSVETIYKSLRKNKCLSNDIPCFGPARLGNVTKCQVTPDCARAHGGTKLHPGSGHSALKKSGEVRGWSGPGSIALWTEVP